jgi:hypothetical protein
MAAISTGLYFLVAGAAARSDLLAALAATLPLGFAAAVYFTGQLRAAENAPPGPLMGFGLGRPEAQVFGAMAVVGFFMFIVTVVAMIPGAVVMGVGLASFEAEIRAAEGDPAAAQAVMAKAIQANPTPFLIVLAALTLMWMLLTSRLFLSAPATLANGKIMSFDTWRWTDGNVWRITAARALLLLPMFFVVNILGQIGATLLGGQNAPTAALAAVQFVVQVLMHLFYIPAEAGLAAYLHRGLKPSA